MEKLAIFFEERFATFVQEIEVQIADRGKELLSIDATGGDTMYFAIVSPQIAQRWRDRKFATIPKFGDQVYTNGVRAPMWDAAWHQLVYAFLLPVTAPTYTRPVPQGVRLRSKTLKSVT